MKPTATSEDNSAAAAAAVPSCVTFRTCCLHGNDRSRNSSTNHSTVSAQTEWAGVDSPLWNVTDDYSPPLDDDDDEDDELLDEEHEMEYEVQNLLSSTLTVVLFYCYYLAPTVMAVKKLDYCLFQDLIAWLIRQ